MVTCAKKLLQTSTSKRYSALFKFFKAIGSRQYINTDVEIGMRPLQRFNSTGAKKVQQWKQRDRQAVREEQQRNYAARVEAVIKIRQGSL
jgi:hypothetical protein